MTKTKLQISGADWLTAKTTQKVMRALMAQRSNCARFVGGCVRNELFKTDVSDIDIATQLTPDATINALKSAGIKAIPTGIEHGTITAVCDGDAFEITSLRRDVETDGRRAVVAFTEDWNEDAQRRDFRVNALYADEEGLIYDPTGGVDDILTRRIVFIGDAETRLREDHLRNLRFFRFSAWYSDGLDPVGLAACTQLKNGLSQIAAERIWKEFGRLLEAPRPFATLAAMHAAGVLSMILPECPDLLHLEAMAEIEEAFGTQFDRFQRLQALLPRDPAIASSVAHRLRFSNIEADRLLAWAKSNPVPDATNDLKAWLYPLAAQTGVDMIVWSRTQHRKTSSTEFWDTALQVATNWVRPEFPVKGKHLLAQGLAAGPGLGRVLSEIEQSWIENDFRLDGIESRFTDPQIRSALQSLR